MEDMEWYSSNRSVKIDCEEALDVLRQAGIVVHDLSQPMDDIAAANGTTPRAIAELVMSVARPTPIEEADALPD
jgi:hypothetical protein